MRRCDPWPKAVDHVFIGQINSALLLFARCIVRIGPSTIRLNTAILFSRESNIDTRLDRLRLSQHADELVRGVDPTLGTLRIGASLPF